MQNNKVIPHFEVVNPKTTAHGCLQSAFISFNNTELERFENANGTISKKGWNKIKHFLELRHKSVFFTTNIDLFIDELNIDEFYCPKYDLQGLSYSKKSGMCVMSVYRALSTIINYQHLCEKYPTELQTISKLIEKTKEYFYREAPEFLEILEGVIDNKNESGTLITKEELIFLNEMELESVNLDIVLPFFVKNQLIRHAFTFNEASARYTSDVVLEYGFYNPEKWRKQNPDKKQCSLESEFIDEVVNLNNIKSDIYPNLLNDNYNWYKNNTENGISKEMARFIIPQSAYTRLYCNITMSTLARICYLRLDTASQVEIRELAEKLHAVGIEKIGEEKFNDLMKLWRVVYF